MKPGRADHLIVTALAQGMTQKEAAAIAGVGERTIRTRLADPEFRERVEAARAELVMAGVGRLSARFSEAVDALFTIGQDPKASHASRVQAYRAALDNLTKLHEISVVATAGRRMDKLESALAALRAEQERAESGGRRVDEFERARHRRQDAA